MRTPIEREPDSLRVSTCPRRTVVENSSPSRTTHSAEDAPDFMARLTTSEARDFRSVVSCELVSSTVLIFKKYCRGQRLDFRFNTSGSSPLPTSDLCNPSLHVSARVFAPSSADGHAVNFDGRDADAHRHSLSIFAAGADALVEF